MSNENLNLPGSQLIERAEVIFEHRFYGNAGDDPFNNFFGTDVGANVALGGGVRLNDRLDLTLLRASLNKEYYGAAKLGLADGVSILLSSATRTTLAGQLILTRGLNDDRFNFSLVPSYANLKPENPTVALGLAAGLSFDASIGYFENFELIAEYIPVISGYAQKYPTAAFGIKAKTPGHFFSLVLTNSTEILPGGYLTGSPDNSFHLGFNIIRKFL